MSQRCIHTTLDVALQKRLAVSSSKKKRSLSCLGSGMSPGTYDSMPQAATEQVGTRTRNRKKWWRTIANNYRKWGAAEGEEERQRKREERAQKDQTPGRNNALIPLIARNQDASFALLN